MRYNIGWLEITKILSILSFVIILVCIYIVAQYPGAQGYEISLYNEYPIYFWYLTIFSILFCQTVILINILYDINSSLAWKSACVGIVISNSILLLIPLIRRYAIYGSGDPSSHMGYMLDVMQTGHVEYNTYPIVHILGVISHQICDFGLDISMLVYPFIFYLFFVLSFYLLYRIVLGYRAMILIGMMLALLLFGGHTNSNIMFFPQGLSNYFVVFLIYLFLIRLHSLHENIWEYSILFVITSIFITFFHPLGSIFLIVTYVIFELTCQAYDHLSKYSYPNHRASVYAILIMISIFFTWHSYAKLLFGTFKRVWMWLSEETIGTSAFDTYSQQISGFKPDFFYLFSSFVYSYGLWLLYMFMGTISIIVIFKAWRDKYPTMYLYATAFSIGFIVFLGIYINSQFLVAGTGYGRVGHYAVTFSLLLIPMAMGYLLDKFKENIYKIKILLAIFLILTVCITYISVYTIYMSPLTKIYGQHVTDSQLIGMNTFFEIRSEELIVVEGGINVFRIKDALYGKSKQLINLRTTRFIPDHFNYVNICYFGDNYVDSRYVIISKLFRILYPNLLPEYPEKWRFNQADFLMLENDKSVFKIYSNRELDVYLINPISMEALV